MAISLAIMASTLSLAALGLEAAKARVADAGFNVLQVSFIFRVAGTPRVMLEPHVLQELKDAVSGAGDITTFSVGEALVSDGVHIRSTQLVSSDAQAVRILMPQLVLDPLFRERDTNEQVCLVDSDQMPQPSLRTVLPAGVQLRTIGRFYLQGAITLAVDPARTALWVPARVFDALPVSNARNFIQLRLRSAEYDRVLRSSAQTRAFFSQRYPQLSVRVYTPWDSLGEIKNTADTVNQMAMLLGSVIAALSAVAMGNAVLVSVKHRQMEIGVRLAIGAQPADIACQLIMETMAIAMVGIVMGWLTALLVTRIWCSWSGWTWLPVYSALALTAGVAVLCGLGASLWPSLSAARMDPAEVLRQ